ncbi:MAG TPA: class I SAM-dependent methyltransferase [Bryobacteraceae bacterium]|jgi:ubiquinone/menaquinone biosynthesis C-methylase UbiE
MAELDAAQSLAVKRAEVEFHNFASLGEPERAMRVYAEENERRGAVIRNHVAFMGELSPFLEIGANAGHTSYYLANVYNADGFALDISADSLRHGIALQEKWGYSRAPVRLAGDALHLPFADNSMRLVMAFQMLSQFMNIEAVFLEVKRVLAPGGIFFFAEEPMRRKLTARLYRCPYYENMKPWERKLSDWGLLGYLVRDVIGAHQEESFGIKQNHTFELKDWHDLIRKHFADHEYELFIPRRGWGETSVASVARAFDKLKSDWTGARLLGGTLAAICKKGGDKVIPSFDPEHFERALKCPDCGNRVSRTADDAIVCANCKFDTPNEGGVYNLLSTQLRAELYPGDRDDIADFSLPGHEALLRDGWCELEGVYGNKYRWIGAQASLVLKRVKDGPQQLRIRGLAVDKWFASAATPPAISVRVNGQLIGNWPIERTGVFILEAPVPESDEYRIEIDAAPTFIAPDDDRVMSVNISMVRLQPQE